MRNSIPLIIIFFSFFSCSNDPWWYYGGELTIKSTSSIYTCYVGQSCRVEVPVYNDGDRYWVTWSFISSPGSTPTLSYDGYSRDETLYTNFATFTPIEAGAYELEFIAHRDDYADVANYTTTAKITIIVSNHPSLPDQVFDSHYSKTVNRIILVSSNSRSLYLLDPDSGIMDTVSLPYDPTSLTVDANGGMAIVGHDSFLSLVSLTNAFSLLRTISVSGTVRDIVMCTNGYVYATATKTGANGIMTVCITNDQENPVWVDYEANASIKLHPSEKSIYVRDRTDYSGKLAGFTITNIVPNGRVDFPGVTISEDFWFSDNGEKVACYTGSFYSASPYPETSFDNQSSPFSGTLDYVSMSSVHNEILVAGFSLINVYDYDNMNYSATINLPYYYVNPGVCYSRVFAIHYTASGKRIALFTYFDDYEWQTSWHYLIF